MSSNNRSTNSDLLPSVPSTLPITVSSLIPHTHPTAEYRSVIAATHPDPTDGLIAKLIAGGVSCMVISAVLNPMDVIKVRLQTQSQYTGFINTGLRIYRDEGYNRGLMRGITASMMREASYSSIRMGLYDYIKAIIAPPNTDKDSFSIINKLTAGCISGAIGSFIATPVDLIKVRFQAYNHININPYKSTISALITTARTTGFYSLYTGAFPSIVRAAVLTSTQLASYDSTKRYLLHSNYYQFNDSAATHIIASIVSGLISCTAVNPADVIKTRIMADCNQLNGRLYSNPLQCVISTYRKEGLRAFMKGWWPNYFRLGPHFLVSLPLAEYIRTQLGADTF